MRYFIIVYFICLLILKLFKYKENGEGDWFYPSALATKNISYISSLRILPLPKGKYLYQILGLLSLSLCKWCSVPAPAVPTAPPYMVRSLHLCLLQTDFCLLEHCCSWICHSAWGLPSVLYSRTAFFDAAGRVLPKFSHYFVFLSVVLDEGWMASSQSVWVVLVCY